MADPLDPEAAGLAAYSRHVSGDDPDAWHPACLETPTAIAVHAAIAAEREACARLCDEACDRDTKHAGALSKAVRIHEAANLLQHARIASALAVAIRARGGKTDG